MENRGKAFLSTLQKAKQQTPLTQQELALLLSAKGPERGRLYAAARDTCREHFGGKVFAYGFVYFSTYCRNNCLFCSYRRDNRHGLRYRKSLAEVLRTSRDLAESGVHLLDLTLGEDPAYVGTPEGIDALLGMALAIKEQTGLPLMLSPGLLPADSIRKAAGIGVDWYALYQETHNQELFTRLRQGQSYDRRWSAKMQARACGMLVEEGVMAGVGETLMDIAASVKAMSDMGASQVRVMSFVPQQGAPLAPCKQDDLYERELNTIAVMRLVMPNRLIPASLDVAGKAGLRERLEAGANVITSLIAPASGMAGVSNATLDVDNGGRSLPRIADVIEQCGLHIATPEEYQTTIKQLRAECGGIESGNYWGAVAGG